MPDRSVDTYLTEIYELVMKCSLKQFVELYGRTFRGAVQLDASAMSDRSKMKEAKLEYFSEISLCEKEELARIFNVVEQIVSGSEADK
jgi:hypothetical protein